VFKKNIPRDKKLFWKQSVTKAGLRCVPPKLRFENRQKKQQLHPNKKASYLFELA
jgi:hypothetical protein